MNIGTVRAGKLFSRSKYEMTMTVKHSGTKTKKATVELFYHGISMGIVKGVINESKAT